MQTKTARPKSFSKGNKKKVKMKVELKSKMNIIHVAEKLRRKTKIKTITKMRMVEVNMKI